MLEFEQETIKNELEIGIGLKEASRLTPEKVKIVQTRIVTVGEKKHKKVVCSVKHPSKEDRIDISSAKIENKGKLESSGLWLNKDEDELILKGSVLATFLEYMSCKTIKQLEDLEVETTEDDKGYLTFKAY